MFRTVLIANRGEIACRIARTARRMGIATVAVYSAADAQAQHVHAADRAMPIGPSPPRESYLNIERIIDAARAAGADAIHPGYGFLSENAEFAASCAAAGIVFVGPSPEAMRAMGDKAAAKALMQQAVVPVVPGYHGERQEPGFLADQAARIGFPVMIKASAGGGGRGMRIVSSAGDFPAALTAARQESAAAFGDERLLLERCVENPRHIEVQVFGDQHGNVVHLFERDCSTQRRHQKVIEEAPAPGIDASRRAAICEAAVAAARAVSYVGAGTVEFIADRHDFFFLEMNTRLQVEHPVTEMITGLDLVEWQLRIAAGEPLPLRQEQLRIDGHAIEARVYAEDPARDFAPSTGRLALFSLPETNDHIRFDAGFITGDTVPVHYDAMLAKLICHGDSRDHALALLRRALAETFIAGVASNLDMLSRIAAHPEFAGGHVDTGFIARDPALLAPQHEPPPEVLAAAALAVLCDEADAASHAAAAGHDPWSPWHARDQWWPNVTHCRVLNLHAGDASHPVEVRRDSTTWQLTIATRTFAASATHVGAGRLAIWLNGAHELIFVWHEGDAITVRRNGETFRLRLPDPIAATTEDDETGGKLIAPLPGHVTDVRATPGAQVARGDVLVVLEAMKTVFRLIAPADGLVATVACRPGDAVEEGQLLVSFADDSTDS